MIERPSEMENINRNERTLRIEHGEDFDVLINEASNLSDEDRRLLLETLRDGSFRQTWDVVEGRYGVGGYVSPDRSYFIKTKQSDRKDFDQVRKGVPLTNQRELPNTSYAFLSVTNELKNAPAVRSVIESEAAQQIAHDEGFSGISFTEPHAAVIDKKTGKRYVAYDCVNVSITEKFPGKFWILSTSPFHGYRIEDVVTKLSKLFAQSGIDAFDLFKKQILVTEETEDSRPMLHLIDTEGYTKL